MNFLYAYQSAIPEDILHEANGSQEGPDRRIRLHPHTMHESESVQRDFDCTCSGKRAGRIEGVARTSDLKHRAFHFLRTQRAHGICESKRHWDVMPVVSNKRAGDSSRRVVQKCGRKRDFSDPLIEFLT